MSAALVTLVRFLLMPGNRFDSIGVAPLIEGITFGALLADKTFDSNAILADLNTRGAKIVISQHPQRAKPVPLDTEMYKWRHVIENFLCKLEEPKPIAMRGCKTDQGFQVIIYLPVVAINARSITTVLNACLMFRHYVK
ncbi:MAG TPA: hypothetical protein VF463_13605 [Sphingobium sp.]